MWLTKLKRALVLEEIDQLAVLIEEMPHFDTLEEMEQAAYLLREAKRLLESKKDETAQILLQLKKSIEFLNSSQSVPSSTINLKL